MERYFYDFKDMENNDILKHASKIRILLHKYIYNDSYVLLELINLLRDQCELSDINYIHNDRSFTIKFNKNTIKKLQKRYHVDELDVNTLYQAIEMPFHDFFIRINGQFSTIIDTASEVNRELNEGVLLKNAFLHFIQVPCDIRYLVQIVSMMTTNNQAIITV